MRRFIIASLMTLTGFAHANDDRWANVQMVTTHVNDSAYMLVGAGGNIGVSAGADGILIIDDQYAPLAEKIGMALKNISETPLKYVINTHYHGDHTGTNAHMHDTFDVTIFAHDNVRKRLDDGKNSASALPVVTYSQGVQFHFNDDTLSVMHFPHAHTDGDSAVVFEKANVLHTGDLFFKDRFPYIDLGAGGSVKGYIAAVESLIDLVSDTTKIIPGHGALASRADYRNFVEMIKATHSAVQAMKASGLSEEQIVEKGLDPKWKDWSWQFIDEARWINTLYPE